MKVISINITFIVFLLIIKKILSTDCVKGCSKCEQSICKSCIDEYILSKQKNLCYQKCDDRQAYDQESGKCTSICSQQQINIKPQSSLCEQVKECPNKIEYGQEYFDTVEQIVVSNQFILLRVTNRDQEMSPIIVLDNLDYKLIGNMKQHKNQILNIFYIPPKQTNDKYNEYLYSYSQNEISKWNLLTTENIYSVNLEEEIIIYNKVNYINEKYLIVMKNDRSNTQFGIVDLQKLDERAIQNGKKKMVYQMFPKYHNNQIQCMCIIGDNIYSIEQNTFITQWNIVKVSFVNSIFSFDTIIQNMYCNEKNNMIIVTFENLNIIKSCIIGNLQCQIVGFPYTSIKNLIFAQNTYQGFKVFIIIGNSEINIFTYNDQIVKHRIGKSTSIQYAYEQDGLIYILSLDGILKIMKYELSPKGNSDDIYEVSEQFFQYSVKSSKINSMILNKNDLLIANSNLNIINISKQNNSTAINRSYIAQKKETKRKLLKQRRGHKDKVNGILFDNAHDRIITYSNDGSFKIWNIIRLSLGEYRLFFSQFHPDCPQYQEAQCNIKLLQMQLLNEFTLLTLYSNNQLILWDYSEFSVKVKILLEMKVDQLILNYYYFNDILLYYSSMIWKAYDLNNQKYIFSVKQDLLYAILDMIDDQIQFIFFNSVEKALIICPYPDCKTQRNKLQILDNVLFIQYYSKFKKMVIGTDNNNLYLIQAQLFKVEILSVNNPVYVSFSQANSNMYVFSQNYTLTYVHLLNTTNTTSTPIDSLNYTVSNFTSYEPIPYHSIFSSQTVTSNSIEFYFFFQNTNNNQIQKQVNYYFSFDLFIVWSDFYGLIIQTQISIQFNKQYTFLFAFGPQYRIYLLLTFTEEISAINVDFVNQKIYVGFQNGQIKTGYFQYFQIPRQMHLASYSHMMYSAKIQQIIACAKNVVALDFYSERNHQNFTNGPGHDTTSNGCWIDEPTMQVVTYSNDTNKNIIKWDLNQNASFIFENGHKNEVKQVFVDLELDRMISFSNDLTFIIWYYSNRTINQTIDTHLQYSKTQQDIGNSKILTVVQFFHDKISHRIFSLNSINVFSSLDYLSCLVSNRVQNNLINFFVDLESVKKKIYWVVQQDSASYIQLVDYQDLKLLQTFDRSSDIIFEVRFIDQRVFIVDPQLIVIRDRNSLEVFSKINSQNPLINNFIVFEKMDHIYIYSEWPKNLNYRIGVYQFSTGKKITDILNSQKIEDGNIAMVFLDQESYQLIIFKSIKLYIYLIDVRTFRFTQYVTFQYSNPIKQGVFIRGNNKFVYRDNSQIRILNIDTALNSENNLRDMTESKSLDYYYNNKNNTLYYIDNEYTLWSQNLTQQLGFQFVEQLNYVKYTKRVGDFFYVISDQNITQYNENFQAINTVNIIEKNSTFTQTHLLLVDNKKNFVCIDLSRFNETMTNSQIPSFPTQIYVEENNEEIFLVMMKGHLQRYNYRDCSLKEDIIEPRLKFIKPDFQSQLIFHVLEEYDITIVIVFKNYSKNYHYFEGEYFGVMYSEDSQISDILVDNKFNRIFVLKLQNLPIMGQVAQFIPNIQVYNFINELNDVSFQLFEILQVPSLLPTTQVEFIDSENLAIHTPYYYAKYISTETSINLVGIIKDNQIAQSATHIHNTSIPSIFILQSLDSLQIVESNFQINYLKVHLKINLLVYKILDSKIEKDGDYIYLDLFGISSGKSFKYRFSINISKNIDKNSNQQCYYQIPKLQTESEFTFKVTNFLQVSELFSLKSIQTKINIDSVGKFYYDTQINQLNTEIIYKSFENQKRVVYLTNDIFKNNQVSLLQIQNYQFNLSQVTGEIVFSNQTEYIVFKDIELIQNPKNTTFKFVSLKQVTLENINIQNINIISSKLFYFEKVEKVIILNVQISNVKSSSDSYIFFLQSVQTVKLISLTMSEISEISTPILLDSRQSNNSEKYNNALIVIINTQNLTIINNNVSYFNSLEQFCVFKLFGIQKTIIQNTEYKNSSKFAYIIWVTHYQSGKKSIYISQNTIQISDSNFKQMTGLQEQSLIYLEGFSVNLYNLTFNKIECQKCDGSALNLEKVSKLWIFNSIFVSNKAQNGGSISMLNCGIALNNNQCQTNKSSDNLKETSCKLLIENSKLEQNQAEESGGAIYLQNSNLEIQNTNITLNSATIGGGVRYLTLKPIFAFNLLEFWNSKNPKFDDKNIIQMNKAIFHSNNIGSHLIKIVPYNEQLQKIQDTSVDKIENNVIIINQVYITSFKSGAYLKLLFQLLDEEQNPLYFNPDKYKDGYSKQLKLEIDNYLIQSTIQNNTIKLFGQQQSDYLHYNQTSKLFNLSRLLIIADPETDNYIHIQSPSVQRPLTKLKSDQQIIEGLFVLKLLIQFRNCVPGEVFRKSGLLYLCQECLEGTYSLVQPSKEQYSVQNCLKCPEQASYCQLNMVTLKSGYWKVSNSSNNVLPCSNNPLNCNGDNQKDYCIKGHIGPLCESCDIYGDVWSDKYAQDGSFNCLNCEEVQSAKNVLPTILFIIGMITYIYFSLRIALQISQLIVVGYYLRMMSLIPVNKSSFQDTTNMNIKSLMNYIQIAQIVNTAKVELPQFITFFPQYLGIKQELNSNNFYINLILIFSLLFYQ